MNGQNLAESAHSVLSVYPQASTGAVSAQAWSMKEAEHVTIYIQFGTEGGSPLTVPVSIIMNQCTSAAGANPTAMAFRYYYQLLGGAGNDVLNGNAGALTNTTGPGPNWAASTGITSFPATVSGLLYVIEMDSAELCAIADAVGTQTEYPYLVPAITLGASSTPVAVLAVLTGMRHAEKASYTQTT